MYAQIVDTIYYYGLFFLNIIKRKQNKILVIAVLIR